MNTGIDEKLYPNQSTNENTHIDGMSTSLFYDKNKASTLLSLP
jgi:hypothetical protein